MSMFATIPIAAGIQPEQTHEPTGILGKTHVQGLILDLRTNGRYTSFFVVFCHYTVYRPLQQPKSGYFVLERVTFMKLFSGFQGMFLIHGTFKGTQF